MPGRIVIISDTHLGRPTCAALSAQALRPLWQDTSRLIINGDIAELHHPDHAYQAEEQVIDLFEFCALDGVILTMLSGNHDPYISDLRHVHIAEGTIFVTHGDVLHPAIAPWSPAAPRVRTAYEKALAAIDPEDRDQLSARLAVSRYASTEERYTLAEENSHVSVLGMLMRPFAIMQVIQYWRMVPHLAAHFTKYHSPDAKFMIFGHTHRPGIWHIDDVVVINTGSFGFPGHPRAVVIEGTTLSVFKIHLRNGSYHLASQPLKTYELPVRVSAPSAVNTRPVRERPNAPAI